MGLREIAIEGWETARVLAVTDGHHASERAATRILEQLRRHEEEGKPPDTVDHPPHYANGVECIDIAEHLSFNVGNALKYVWRRHAKGDPVENLRKAEWYLRRAREYGAAIPTPVVGDLILEKMAAVALQADDLPLRDLLVALMHGNLTIASVVVQTEIERLSG